MDESALEKVIAHAVEVALLKQTVERNERAIVELTVAVRDLSVQVTTMATTMSTSLAEARGGWKVLLALGGAAATVGSAVTWLLAHFKFGP